VSAEAVEAVDVGVEELVDDAVVAEEPLFEAVELDARSEAAATCFVVLLSVRCTAWCTGDVAVFVLVIDFVGFVAAPEAPLAEATLELFCESGDTVVSPVDALSTGVADGVAVGVVIAEAVFVVESVAATVLSLLAASFRAHATARLSTPPMSMARPTAEKDGPAESSKQRFINMLVRSCTLPWAGDRSARGAYCRHVVFH
jgi:hypothetical protein